MQVKTSHFNRPISYLGSVKETRPKNYTLAELVNGIRAGAWKQGVEAVRTADGDARIAQKKKLPCVLLSGQFHGAKAKDLDDASGLLQLDFDKVDDPSTLRDRLKADPYIVTAFVSPSGNGVKGVIQIPPAADLHKLAFKQVSEYIHREYGLEIDPACKDICRKMFVSYDQGIWVDEAKRVFEVKPEPERPKKKRAAPPPPSTDDTRIAVEALKYIRAENRDDWIEVGMALKASQDKVQNAYELWVQWSAGATTFLSEEDCRKTWASFQGRGREFGSLIHKAKQNGYETRREEPAGPRPQPPPEEPRPGESGEMDSMDSMLLKSKKGEVRGCLANAIVFVRHHFGGSLARNLWTDKTEITGELPWNRTAGDWSDLDDTRALEWLQKMGCFLTTPQAAGRAVEAVASERSVHPLREYLEGLKWDGVERLRHWLADFCGAEQTVYTADAGEKWLTAAVGRVFQPGLKFDSMIVLEGAEGIGKSSTFNILAGDDYFTDDMPDFQGKDAAERTQAVWIIELSELDTLKRSEVSQVKAFITRRMDRYRPAYGRRVQEYPRTCILGGTVNPEGEGWLKDTTGANRRFWPIPCTTFDTEGLRVARDQLLAEAVVRFRAGLPLWLDNPESVEIANSLRAERKSFDPWMEDIEGFLSREGRETVTTATILDHLEIDVGRRSQYDNTRVSKILHILGWEKYRPRVGTKRTWMWREIGGVVPSGTASGTTRAGL